MKTVKVTFQDGNYITTKINGTNEEIMEYYKIGRYFNLGQENDEMQKVSFLEFL